MNWKKYDVNWVVTNAWKLSKTNILFIGLWLDSCQIWLLYATTIIQNLSMTLSTSFTFFIFLGPEVDTVYSAPLIEAVCYFHNFYNTVMHLLLPWELLFLSKIVYFITL